MTVADILAEMAAQAGRSRVQRGALIGNTIENLASLPGQIANEHERRAIFEEQRARQRTQDARQARGDARDEAVYQSEQRQNMVRHAVLQAYTGGTPNDPSTNSLEAGIAKALELDAPELIEPLRKQHQAELEAARPKITQTNPEHDVWENGVLTKPGVKPPKSMTPTDLAVLGMNANPVVSAFAKGALNLTRAPKSVESKNVLLDGKPAIVNFNPGTGAHTLPDGTDVSTRVKPIPPASAAGNPGAVDNVKEAVAGMKDGTLPPVMPGRASRDYTAILAEARRQGFNLGQANLDWNATQKHVATMNGAQQLRLNQAINSLPEMLDKVDALASQWKGGRFPVLNKANLALAKGGAYGPDVASVANQLDAQIADVTADLGNVYMGGNSPTDHALGLAGKSLKGEWDEKVLHDMVKLAKTNVTIRRHSIDHTGVAGASADNPYAPRSAPAAGGGMIEAIDPQGNLHHAPAGTPLPAGWTLK